MYYALGPLFNIMTYFFGNPEKSMKIPVPWLCACPQRLQSFKSISRSYSSRSSQAMSASHSFAPKHGGPRNAFTLIDSGFLAFAGGRARGGQRLGAGGVGRPQGGASAAR